MSNPIAATEKLQAQPSTNGHKQHQNGQYQARGFSDSLHIEKLKTVFEKVGGSEHQVVTENTTTSDDGVAPGTQKLSVEGMTAWMRQLITPGWTCLWIKNFMAALEGTSTNLAGYFDDPAKLVQAALKYSGKSFGIYVSANPVKADHIPAKATNCVTRYAKPPDESAIACRRRLVIDVDPCRDGICCATAAEKKAALERAKSVREYLDAQGWPEPLVMDSGNGVQIAYRINLPVNDGHLVHNVLKAIGPRFNDSAVHIDTKLGPAKQLIRCVGTMNCKGENTPQRPHRPSCLLSAPAGKLELVPQALLEKVISHTPQASCVPAVRAVPVPPAPADARPADLDLIKHYLDKMAPAIQGKDGSTAAIKAARAIVVGFDIPWNSDDAWTLFQHYNARCVPPWNLADGHECQDLRRKLQEAHGYALANGHDRGYLRRDPQAQSRHFEPLVGQLFPYAIPDYDWMASDTPELVLDNPPVPFAFGLWMFNIWQKRHKDVLVPEILAKVARWGANAPRHWRQQYLKEMQAAMQECPSLRAVAPCGEACPFHGMKKPHKHYKLDDAVSAGIFDDFEDENGKHVIAGVKRAEYRNTGKIYHGYWPALVFGTAKPMGLTPRQIKLLMTITRELTRVSERPNGEKDAKGRKVFAKVPSDRPDRAQVIRGNKVHNSGYTARMIVCPILDKDKSYVGFCGNLRRHRGRGYKIGDWAVRAGYAVSIADVKALMADLAVLATTFELTVVGRHHKSRSWYTLDQLRDFLDSGWGVRRINETLMRIYGPEDFLTLWRYRFAERLGFRWIPGGEGCPFKIEDEILGPVNNSHELLAWLKENHVTREEFCHRAKIARKTLYRRLRRSATSRRVFWEKVNRAIQEWGT